MSTPSDSTPQPERAPDTGTQELIDQIKQLVGKLDAPKRKSLWDVLPVMTTFLGTVVLAAISLYVTQSYQRQESERAAEFKKAEAIRQDKFNQAQIEAQRAQMRVEELKALTALAPMLASHDANTRETARKMLQAVKESGASNAVASFNGLPDATGNSRADNSGADNSSAGNSSAGNSSTASRGGATSNAGSSTQVTRPAPAGSRSLLDTYVDIALSPTAAPAERVDALRKSAEIASRTTSKVVRNRVADAAVQIALSEDAPAAVKSVAAEVMAKIKQLRSNEAAQQISSEIFSRQVTEVILHHSGVPAGSYKGAETIFAFARVQGERPGFHGRIGWHYAIAPDGAIWAGTPLNEQALNARDHNKSSVS